MTATRDEKRDENILIRALVYNRFFVAKFLLDEKVNIASGWIDHQYSAVMQSFECFQLYYTHSKYHQKPLPVTHSKYLEEALHRWADPKVFPFLCGEFKVRGEIAEHLEAAVINDQKQNVKFIATYPYRHLQSFSTQNGPNRKIVFSMQHHLTHQLNCELTRANCEMAETLISVGARVNNPSSKENNCHRELKASIAPTSVSEFITPTTKQPNLAHPLMARKHYACTLVLFKQQNCMDMTLIITTLKS